MSESPVSVPTAGLRQQSRDERRHSLSLVAYRLLNNDITLLDSLIYS